MICKETGKKLTEIEHLKQSVRDILLTPLGSRCMCRDYGSRLFELIDEPINELFWSEVFAATAEALEKWEPRLKILNIRGTKEQEKIEITISGEFLPQGKEINVGVSL